MVVIRLNITMAMTYDYDWFKGTYLAEQSRLQQDAIATEQKLKTKINMESDDIIDNKMHSSTGPSSLARILNLMSEFNAMLMTLTTVANKLRASLQESMVDDNIEEFAITVNNLFNKAKEIDDWSLIILAGLKISDIEISYIARILKSVKQAKESINLISLIVKEIHLASPKQKEKFNRALVHFNGSSAVKGAKQLYVDAIRKFLSVMNILGINSQRDYLMLERLIETL